MGHILAPFSRNASVNAMSSPERSGAISVWRSPFQIDVTPADLITAIVCEKAVVKGDYRRAFEKMLA